MTCHYNRDCCNTTKKVGENANLMIEKNKIILRLLHNKGIQDKRNMWYLNNGPNNHMYGYKDKIIELDETIV